MLTRSQLRDPQISNVGLNDERDVRIVNFYRARDVRNTDQAITPLAQQDMQRFRAKGWPLEEARGSLDFAFDMFCVGVTLFEMATGKEPDLSLEQRAALLATVDDPLKRELIAFALRITPSDRPTAAELLETFAILSPSTTAADEFRAQVFASMRFNDNGPMAEAKLLRGKLASQGVHLHIISPKAGESIDRAVFDTMAQCDGFIAMATEDVRCACAPCCWRRSHEATVRPAVWRRHGEHREHVP